MPKLNMPFAEWYGEFEKIEEFEPLRLTGDISLDLLEIMYFMVGLELCNGKTLLPKLKRNMGYKDEPSPFCEYDLYIGFVKIENGHAIDCLECISSDGTITKNEFYIFDEYEFSIIKMLNDLVNQILTYYDLHNIIYVKGN